MELLPLLAPVEADMRRVDAVIRARLASDVALVARVAEYIVGGGGKRLRPALVLLSAGACGYPGNAGRDGHLELAAVVEFIHTATLLHDDVVDGSELRRGRNTANAEFGNAASVLVGDFLYSRAFQMMLRVDSMRVMRVLADATNTIAEGEVLQLMNCHDPEVGEARYLEVIRRKTAKLFEAAARLGAVLANASPSIRGRACRVRHAPGHRVPADRRRARLFGRRGRDRQEPGRRSGRRQAHAAAHPRHGERLGGAGRRGAARDRRGRARRIRERAGSRARDRRAGLRARGRRA